MKRCLAVGSVQWLLNSFYVSLLILHVCSNPPPTSPSLDLFIWPSFSLFQYLFLFYFFHRHSCWLGSTYSSIVSRVIPAKSFFFFFHIKFMFCSSKMNMFWKPQFHPLHSSIENFWSLCFRLIQMEVSVISFPTFSCYYIIDWRFNLVSCDFTKCSYYVRPLAGILL